MTLILTFAALNFLVLLIIIYYEKMKFISRKRNIYLYFVIACLLNVITEILVSLAFNTGNVLIEQISTKIHWICILFSLWTFYIYIASFCNKIEGRNLKEAALASNNTKLVSILDFILIIIIVFLPFGNFIDDIIYLPTEITFYSIGVGFLNIIFILIGITMKKQNVKKNVLNTFIFLGIAAPIIFILQVLIPNISMFMFFQTIFAFIFYLIVENPDLEVIDELEGVNNQIEDANNIRLDALYNIPVKINPIIDNINTNIDIVTELNKDEIIKTNLKNVVGYSNSILDEVDNIVESSLLKSNKIVLENNPYNTKDLINKLITFVNNQNKNTIKFITNIDNNLPSKLEGDYNKLYKILVNILSNAIKYTDVGKILFNIKSSIKDDNCELKIEITDSGNGMNEDLVNLINNLKVSNFNEDIKYGYGIFIVKKYCDIINAKLECTSSEGVGTSYYITLNEKIIDLTPISNNSDIIVNTDHITYSDYSNKTIAIVSESDVDAKILEKILKGYKCKIEVINDFSKLLYNVKIEENYSVIILDEYMKELDYYDMIYKLRKLEGYILPPIMVMLSGDSSSNNEKDVKIDEIINLPINVNEFDNLLHKYLDK